MPEKTYISVILPLKLEWEPCYSIPEGTPEGGIAVGDRVKVTFAGKSYSGVVSATDITPDTAPSKIKPFDSIEDGLERILPEEIRLWKMVAEYYMCTVGEVYKAAYPVSKINLEEAHAAAVARAHERQARLLDVMRQKVGRIEERLTKKENLAAKAKEGTKSKAKYAEEAIKIRQELETAVAALKNAEEKASRDSSKSSTDVPQFQPVSLTPVQNSAFDEIQVAFGSGKPVLIQGVTGSGKTEIYVKLAQEALS